MYKWTKKIGCGGIKTILGVPAGKISLKRESFSFFAYYGLLVPYSASILWAINFTNCLNIAFHYTAVDAILQAKFL